jgi:hypothetical protein
LEVDDGTALILYSNGYRTFEDIVSVGEEEFAELPGMKKETLKKIYAAALVAKEKGIVTADVISKIIEAQNAEAAAAVATTTATEAASSDETVKEENNNGELKE